MNEFQIIVAGAAGQGSKKAGLVIANLFNAYGFRVFIHEDYESLIKGGHNFSQISVSRDRVMDVKKDKVDFLLALNEDSILKHKERINEEGVLIYDAGCTESEFHGNHKNEIKISLHEIVKEAKGIDLMKNTALVAAFSKIIGMEWKKVKSVLEKEFPIETKKNIEVAHLAFQKMDPIQDLRQTGEETLLLLSGNEATAMGAMDAGLQNYFAYPMTPATSILRFFVNNEKVQAYQPENEIAAVSMALGSAYAGNKSMTGTSGGGFALMTESISFSAQAEIPLVIALSQRMGPATGVPTYQSQGDLLFALNSGHGDMQRLVVAPGNAEESYYLSGEALSMAWKYQMPAIILLDKELSENTYQIKERKKATKDQISFAENEENYNRYEGEDISPLAFPGGEAVVKVTGYEHDKKGISQETWLEVMNMQEKRIRKYAKLKEEVEEMDSIKVKGEGDVVIFFWGSTKGVVTEVTRQMEVKTIQPLIMQPFPENKVKEALRGTKKIICVENNATGQLAKLLRAHGIETDEKILKYDGRPFCLEELKEKILFKLWKI